MFAACVMQLARIIQTRLENELRKSPEITARALRIYEPKLPDQLMKAWGQPEPYDPYDEDTRPTKEDDLIEDDL